MNKPYWCVVDQLMKETVTKDGIKMKVKIKPGD